MHDAGDPTSISKRAGSAVKLAITGLLAVVVLAACGSDSGAGGGSTASTESSPISTEFTAGEITAGEITAGEITAGEVTVGEVTTGTVEIATGTVDEAPYRARLDLLQQAVSDWNDATTVDAAHAAAETAANLVVGPGGPGYGDRDGDGTVSGESDAGLLTGLGGTPEGIAVSLAENPCVARDVLGSTVDDVDGGWAEMEAAIAAWRPDDNTMPSLASHPMRVVGWATFTIAADDLADAHEYAGHAQLHVDVSTEALDC